MGNLILKNDERFFKISNCGLDFLYEKLKELENEGKVLSKVNKKFIEAIQYGAYGWVALELTDFYENHPQDLSELIELIQLILDNAAKNSELTPIYYEAFNKFNEDLKEYLSTLTK